eukprot:1608753-Prymnesium_polylepis.1
MGSSYPTTTPPGRFGRPRRNSVGHASSPLYEQPGGTGGISTLGCGTTGVEACTNETLLRGTDFFVNGQCAPSSP